MPYDQIAGCCYNDASGRLRSWGHGPRFRTLLVDAGQHASPIRGRGKGPQIQRYCANCSVAGVAAKGRCWACYTYLRRTGKERPSRFFARPKPLTGYVT